MGDKQQRAKQPYLVWVSIITPSTTLDSATWLDTTRELQRLGWRVTLIGKGAKGWHDIQGVKVLCLPHPQIYFLGQWIFHFNILRFLAQEWADLDVILFHQISALWLLPLRFVRRLLGRQRPLLVMDTRDFSDFAPDNWKIRLRMLFNRLVSRMAVHWADGQTTITPRMARLVKIPPTQLWGIWPSGVNPKSFAPAQSNRCWPTVDEPIHLMYIGILLPKRNLLPLCQAVAQANRDNMSFVLSLIGDGPERVALEAFAAQTGGQVRVLPPVPHDQIPKLLAKAHIGVTSLPAPDDTKYQASSPIKLFEYMAAGLPVLSTRSVCHTDVVGDGPYAFWAADAGEATLLSALSQIWQSRTFLSELGCEAMSAAQAWTWQAAAMKLSDALEQGTAKASNA